MELVQFCTGFVAGAGLLAVYFYKERRKWNEKTQVEASIFQLVESSKDMIYYLELGSPYKYRYMSPSVDIFLGEGTLQQLHTDPYKTFEIVHAADAGLMQQKLTGAIDYSKSIIQRFQHQDGSYRYFEEHATPIYKDGELVAIQGVMRNIDETVKLQQNLEYEVSHDALTRIFNRRSFECQMERFNAHENVSVAVLLCDLDDLKLVNDQYGHKQGDEMIYAAAQFLAAYFSERAIVSRVGGDEFAVILYDITASKVEALLAALPEAVQRYNDEQQMPIQLSIGYAFSADSTGKMEMLYMEADASMYVQKRQRKTQMNMS